MQSYYWVMTWACHRRCKHCYDDRFRPYVRDELKAVVREGQTAYEKIIANLPDEMRWWNPETESYERSLMVLAGGELLIEGVREELFVPAVKALHRKYGDKGPKLAIQTTGDILTEERLDQLLELGIESIAIASIDDYHVGMSGEKKFRFMKDIRALMASRDVQEVSLGGVADERLEAPAPEKSVKLDQPTFLFFGAQPDLWIGELWPRGRAFANGLSNAGYDTNFCARWSGGLNFLKLGQAGSEISIEPNGNIYPCCLKTRFPLGNLTEERLSDIFASIETLPAIQAINAGDPEAMGESAGWSRDVFREKSAHQDGKGRIVENMCLGCDSFFEEHLGKTLEKLRQERLGKRVLIDHRS